MFRKKGRERQNFFRKKVNSGTIFRKKGRERQNFFHKKVKSGTIFRKKVDKSAEDVVYKKKA